MHIFTVEIHHIQVFLHAAVSVHLPLFLHAYIYIQHDYNFAEK